MTKKDDSQRDGFTLDTLTTPDEVRERQVWKLAQNILRAVTKHQAANFAQAVGEIHLSVTDCQLLHDTSSQRRQGYVPRYNCQDGDTGTLWGRPFRANKLLAPGEAFVGYRVTAD